MKISEIKIKWWYVLGGSVLVTAALIVTFLDGGADVIIIRNQKTIMENQLKIETIKEYLKNDYSEGVKDGIDMVEVGYCNGYERGWFDREESREYDGCGENKQETILDNIEISYWGIASWYDYSLPSYPDYSKNHLTCASRDYERGVYLTVEREGTDKVVKCRVNDYIEHPDRIIDLSSYAFKQLAPLNLGLINVKVYAER